MAPSCQKPTVCHMTKLALVLATHAAASLRAETDIFGGGGCLDISPLVLKAPPSPYISVRLGSTYALFASPTVSYQIQATYQIQMPTLHTC